MAILDWIKEIPLSAVYKERLVDSEKQISLLVNKVSILETENIELKSRLSQCEENRRALEKQIEQKLIDSHSDSLSDVQENILSGFIENERLSPEMIADVLDIKSALASYHLNVLHKKDYVIELSINENLVYWGITQAGREYLFSHGLLG